MIRALVILLALALAGCQQTVTQAKVDTAIDNTVPVLCAAMDVAYLGWQAANVKVDEKLGNKIKATYIAAKGVCLNPPENSVEALAAALNAYRDFKAALRSVKDGNGSGASG